MIIKDKNPVQYLENLISEVPLSGEELKTQGNKEFQQKNFQTSINLYLNALNKAKLEPFIDNKLVMVLHGNLSQAYNQLKNPKFYADSAIHIEKAILLMKEIDATETYAGLSPEMMMMVNNSLKHQYLEKFSYRKAVALSH